jgi:hypothetical protein
MCSFHQGMQLSAFALFFIFREIQHVHVCGWQASLMLL